MATLEHILHVVSRLPDEQLRAVCLGIVQAVGDHLDPRPTQEPFWTTGVIAGWIGVEANDPALLRSLQLLAGWTDAQLLDVRYMYFDPAGLHPQGQKVSDAAVQEAYATGTFEDPDSGELIADFEHTLEPYFIPAPTLGGRQCD